MSPIKPYKVALLIGKDISNHHNYGENGKVLSRVLYSSRIQLLITCCLACQ